MSLVARTVSFPDYRKQDLGGGLELLSQCANDGQVNLPVRFRFVFACHGTLEAGKLFETGFELYEDERLVLLEIVRSHLPAAEFAFPSACHMAEVTEGNIMDENLHLATAVQYCGFRNVVRTMWAMMDEDGRDLAENFTRRCSIFQDQTRVYCIMKDLRKLSGSR